jgi:hypothetical protein
MRLQQQGRYRHHGRAFKQAGPQSLDLWTGCEDQTFPRGCYKSHQRLYLLKSFKDVNVSYGSQDQFPTSHLFSSSFSIMLRHLFWEEWVNTHFKTNFFLPDVLACDILSNSFNSVYSYWRWGTKTRIFSFVSIKRSPRLLCCGWVTEELCCK